MAGFSLSNAHAMQESEQVSAQDLLAQANVYLQKGHQFIKFAEDTEENLTSFKGSLREKAKQHYYQSHSKLLIAFQKGNQSARDLLAYNKKVIEDLHKTADSLDGLSYDEGRAQYSLELCKIYDFQEKSAKDIESEVTWPQLLRETYLSQGAVEKAEESLLGKAKRKLTSSLKKVTNQ